MTEFQPGAAIGWHKDKADVDEVVGISLGASCTMRFRRARDRSWKRRNVVIEPGSAYIITGEAIREGALHPAGGGSSILGDVPLAAEA